MKASESVPAAVLIGTFDGVHRGHRHVIGTAVATGLPVRVLTFEPHPRAVLGNLVELLTTVERRLELLRAVGASETVVLEFTLAMAQLEPEEFAAEFLRPDDLVVAGGDFRFGRKRRGDLELLRSLGHDVQVVPRLPEVSSSEIRRLLHDGDVRGAAGLLGRAPELDGVVVPGDQRGGTLGYPTANLALDPRLLVPRYGIYAGAARGPDGSGTGRRCRSARTRTTAARSGGSSRTCSTSRATCTGERLVVELWERLRDERAFASEQELVEQICPRRRADARCDAAGLSSTGCDATRPGPHGRCVAGRRPRRARPMTLTPPK